MIFYLDLETTVEGGPDGDSPEAHWLNNKVLLCGWTSATSTHTVHPRINTNTHAFAEVITKALKFRTAGITIVAHNAKFDLKYLMRDNPEVEWHKVRVWDTMTYEYLASGHNDKFISLEDACKKRGISFKKSLDLGALLKQGVKMQDIPTVELEEYLKEDIKNLHLLYQEQLKDKYYPDMDYILPLCEMELNGLPIDRTSATKLGTSLSYKINSVENIVITLIKCLCEWQDGTAIEDEDFSEMLGTKSKTIKPLANRTISFLLFGAPNPMKVSPKWQLRLKNGIFPYFPLHECNALFKDAPTNLGYPVGEAELQAAAKVRQLNLITAILNYRKATKLMGTYVGPFLNTSKIQGKIYPKLNTTVTATGRLSSSDPNGQNIPPEARALVVPDDKLDEIVEIDFSQLEMIGAAAESGDPTMIQDLKNGEDLHFNTGKIVMGWKDPSDMTKEQRTLVKNVNFGLLYGGKAAGLSAQTGVDKSTIQDLIDAFYRRYPRVQEWQLEVFQEVCTNLKPFDIHKGEQRYASLYTLPISNRRFLFVENESPKWMRNKTGRGFSFSPQHTANYPIQGFAGGDIVMSALHYLWCAVHSTGAANYIKFRMTVHDSIVLQVRKGVNLTLILEKMCEYVKQRYNLPVDLHVDVESGSYWH